MDPNESASPLPQAQPVDETHADGSAHDFEIQKRVHQQIRNDPDYDDWDYGTEPLPKEAWPAPQPGAAPH